MVTDFGQLINICSLPNKGISKYWIGYSQHDGIFDDIEMLRSICLANQKFGTQRYEILLKHEKQFRRVVLFCIVMVFFVWITLILFPILAYLLTGNWVLLLPMSLPWIDANTTSGYFVLNIFGAILVSMVCLGSIASDGVMALSLVHIRPMVDLFELGFEELNDVLVRCPNAKDSTNVKLWLRNLIKLHQDMTTYEIPKK